MSVSEFAEEVNWEGVYQAANDGLPEYDSQTEWREPFDLARGLQIALLESGIMPPEIMPDVLYQFVLWRRDGYLAELVYDRWRVVDIYLGFNTCILISELRDDFPINKIAPAEVVQNSAQCIMNLCSVLAERDGEFSIPSTFIGGWLGIRQQDASMILKRLEQAGHLVRLGDTITYRGKKTPLWAIGDGIPLKVELKPKKPRKKTARQLEKEAKMADLKRMLKENKENPPLDKESYIESFSEEEPDNPY